MKKPPLNSEVYGVTQKAEDFLKEGHHKLKGEVLKAERLKQGISLETVHEATKIPLDALRGLEEGYTIKMLTPFYIKGFLKIYAKYLNLDVAHFFEDYKVDIPSKSEKENVKNFQALELQSLLNKFFTKKRRQQVFVIFGAVLVLLLVVKFVGYLQHRPKKIKVTPAKVEADKAVQKEESKAEKRNASSREQKFDTPAVTALQPPAAQSTGSASSGQLEAIPAAKKITLTVRANAKSWLSVKADGQTVFQAQLGKGAVETWQANEAIEISGKNIYSLAFELNGKLIGTLGRSDRSAKKVIITEKGLSVSK